MNAGCSDTDDRLELEGIWPEEILDINRFNCDTGGFGIPVKATVVAKYPFLVLLDNGMSFTYADLARYYRNAGRKRCIA